MKRLCLFLVAVMLAVGVTGCADETATTEPATPPATTPNCGRGHGRDASAYRYQEGLPDDAGLPTTMMMGCTACHVALDTGDTSPERRRHAVAGFIAELAAGRLETDWGTLSDLIEWTCAQILRPGPPTEFERAWNMATTALAGRARTRVWLLGPFARLPHQKPRAPQKDDPPSPRHLMHAIERFPDGPYFQFARVTAWTWGCDVEPIRKLRRDDDGRSRARVSPRVRSPCVPMVTFP